VIGEVPITTLSSRQYCVVVDPVDSKTGRPQFGKRELRKGEASFFLRPGERLEAGIQSVHVLDSDEALLLRARDAYEDGKEKRKPGDRWMIYGPTDYVPPVTVDIVEKRKAIPLDVNEGIYVRDITTGVVRSEKGTTYMLKPFEELWNKEVPAIVEELLSKEVTLSKDWKQPTAGDARTATGRDKSRVVTFRTPHNSAVQVFDFTAKKARVVFGPELVALGSDEQFTVLSLSGDVPKRPHVIRSLSLLLGPDFMTDVVVVETSDHARLSLKLSYNWYFEVDRKAGDSSKFFSVPDFVGDACKALASRVRGAVASQTFDDFHKHSARIIREAVFGLEADGSVKNKLVFSSNNLTVTNIDIQSVEPVDSKTRDALQKSVQLAIEITTKSQEASASHEANRREQQARGKLERQKIKDEAEAERSRTDLLSLQAQSAAVESTGQATAEAKARADAAAIEGAAAVKQAELSSEAERIKLEARLERTKASQEAEIAHQKAVNDLEIKKARDLGQVEATKFKSIVEAIGADTLEHMSRAAGETQARLLESLNLKTNMITDGNSPINLFTTATGLIANQ
jgi:major vault protein